MAYLQRVWSRAGTPRDTRHTDTHTGRQAGRPVHNSAVPAVP